MLGTSGYLPVWRTAKIGFLAALGTLWDSVCCNALWQVHVLH